MEHEPIERSAREVRAHLADVIGDAIAGKVTFITSNGRRVAAVVPITAVDQLAKTGLADDE
jgi:prevent-host-death family protein